MVREKRNCGSQQTGRRHHAGSGGYSISRGKTECQILGLPQTQSLWLPITLPELVLWKREKQQGFSRFYLDMFDAETDAFLGTTEPYIGSVTQTTYTVFFFFDWKNTDLGQPL